MIKLRKINFSPKNIHLSMELELVIGTIRKGVKSTIEMHILIFIMSFQEKVKNYFLFSVIFCIISHVLPQKS